MDCGENSVKESYFGRTYNFLPQTGFEGTYLPAYLII